MDGCLKLCYSFIKKVLILFRIVIFLLMAAVGADAIVSITPVVIGAKPGFSGKAQGSLATNRGNVNSDSYGGGLRLQYDEAKRYVVWGEFSGNYASASGQAYSDNTFAHIRYIHKLLPKEVDWEAFVQSQTNQFTDIKERLLEGGDIRWHFKNKKLGDLFFGAGGFYEHIIYTTSVNPTENNVRYSFYLSYVKVVSKSAKFSYIGYYQPKVNKLSDYLISNSAQLKINIYKQLFLNFQVEYDIDSVPPVGIQKSDFSQTTSFMYQF